jgi:hypothetical protein
MRRSARTTHERCCWVVVIGLVMWARQEKSVPGKMGVVMAHEGSEPPALARARTGTSRTFVPHQADQAANPPDEKSAHLDEHPLIGHWVKATTRRVSDRLAPGRRPFRVVGSRSGSRGVATKQDCGRHPVVAPLVEKLTSGRSRALDHDRFRHELDWNSE